MTDIQLPCCDTIARVESLEDEIRCEGCGVVLEIADDGPVGIRTAA
jgi:hypothetical protein